MAFVITTIGFTICSLPPLCKVNLSIHKNRYDEEYGYDILRNNCNKNLSYQYVLTFGLKMVCVVINHLTPPNVSIGKASDDTMLS